jgi:hypothetical protein
MELGANMSKRKTSIAVDDNLWREWTKFVVDKTGSARKVSEELENAIKDYMKKHREESNKVIKAKT